MKKREVGALISSSVSRGFITKDRSKEMKIEMKVASDNDSIYSCRALRKIVDEITQTPTLDNEK